MSDNVLSAVLFVLIAAVAVATTVEIVDRELALRRAVAAARAESAAIDDSKPPAAEPETASEQILMYYGVDAVDLSRLVKK